MSVYFDPAGEVADAIATAIGDPVHVVTTQAELERLVETHRSETLVVIGPGAEAHAAFELAAAHRIHRPELAVVLLRRRIDSSLLSAAMRSGVREVIRAEAVDTLAEACTRARSLAEQVCQLPIESLHADGNPNKIVTVFSAKGGCGKTTVATNLAAAIAVAGRRVCIVDIDLPFGDIAIMLQLSPQRSLADAVTMSGHIDEVGVRSIVTTHPSGVDVVVAPVDPADAERITPSLITDLLTRLKAMYDVVVVDTPPAFTEQVLAALDVTDVHLLVATPDIPAVKNLKLTIEMLDMLGAPGDRQRLVLNRADAKVGLTRADVERALHRSILSEIPSSQDVPAAVNRATPLVLEQPNHPVSRALTRLAVEAELLQPPARPQHKQPRARRAAFLRRGAAPA